MKKAGKKINGKGGKKKDNRADGREITETGSRERNERCRENRAGRKEWDERGKENRARRKGMKEAGRKGKKEAGNGIGREERERKEKGR